MDFTFSRLCGPSGAIRRSRFHFRQSAFRTGGSTAWLSTLAVAQALGFTAHAQDAFDPGLPPTLASPRIPGPAPVETTRRTAGSDYFLGGGFQAVPNPGGGQRDYNFKLGGLTGSFYAATSFMYSDNVILSGNGADNAGDFSITPSVGVNLFYPITQYSELDLTLGVGYIFYVDHTELNRLTASILPQSVLRYRFLVGDILFTLFNQASFPANYNDRPEIRGNGSAAAVDLNRISNRTGASASWAVNQDLSLTGGYAFGLDRSLGDSYGQLDANTHNFNAGAYQQLGERWTTGVSGTYSIYEYQGSLQNDSRQSSVGPLLSWRATDFLSFNAQVGYTVVSVDQTSIGNTGSALGVIDTSEFAGLTYQLGAIHRINKSMSHSLTVGDSVSSGLGSNYTESFTVGYGFQWTWNERIGFNFGVSYANFKQSAAQRVYIGPLAREFQFADAGDSVVLSAGTGYPFTRKLHGSLQYTHQIRNSDRSDYNYHVNTVTLSLTYSF